MEVAITPQGAAGHQPGGKDATLTEAGGSIAVIGGGLAGAEAAYQLARRGASVTLYEMRPVTSTPAHKTSDLAELVCSNSLKSKELSNAHGLLKEELRLLGSLVLEAADRTAIPGGKALVVDRARFAGLITGRLSEDPAIQVVRREVEEIPAGTCIVATGPLTSPGLSVRLAALTGQENLHFFDAVSPIIDGATIDMDHAFFGSRYMEGSDDYLNCPLTRGEYDVFYDALMTAKRVELREFEKTPYFEGCLPIEVMAERGKNTLLFGPMKPVGMGMGRDGEGPAGVVQLRREDSAGTMYNMVGFQTKLTYPEQERVFRLIPALRNAVFFRYCSVHRNTFINGPAALAAGLRLKSRPDLFLAGQITGVEGYMESTAMGVVAALAALCAARGRQFVSPPVNTCVGALHRYVTTERKDFQPMNVNFGLFPDWNKRKKPEITRRALESIAAWREEIEGAIADR